MKKIFWIFICYFISIHLNGQNNNQVIKFKSMGESDKPIPSLYIQYGKVIHKNDHPFFGYNVIVSFQTFLYIKQYLKSNKQKESNQINSEAAFLVEIDSSIYAILNRNKGVYYFNRLSIFLKNNKKLPQEDIENINQKLSNIILRIY